MKHLNLTLSIALVSGLSSAQNASSELTEAYMTVGHAGATEPVSRGNLWTPSNSTSSFVPLFWFEDANTRVQVLPMHQVMGMADISATDILLVGRRTTGSSFVGHVAHVRLDYQNDTMSVLSSADIGSVDPMEICYDDQGDRIYVLDAIGRQVVSASWSGSGALPGESAYGTVVDHTSQASLERLNGVTIRPGDQGGVAVCEPNGVRYSLHTWNGSGWATDSSAWSSALRQPWILSDTRFLPVNQPWTLEVAGPVTYPLAIDILGEGGMDIDANLTAAVTTFSPLNGTEVPATSAT